jgi:hypothetical protein
LAPCVEKGTDSFEVTDLKLLTDASRLLTAHKFTFRMSSTNITIINGDKVTVSVGRQIAHLEDDTVDLIEPNFSIDGKLILPPEFFVYGQKRLSEKAAMKWKKFIPYLVPKSYSQSIPGLIEYTEAMYNEILDIGKTNYKKEVLRLFNEAGYRRSFNWQKLSKFEQIGELFSDKRYPKRKLLCDSWNIAHCINTETGNFLNSTIPTKIREWASELDKPWIFSVAYDSISENQKRKKVHHPVIKIANSAISDIKKKHQDIEDKSFGITCRTTNQKMRSLKDTYYAIPYFFGSAKCYLFVRKTKFQGDAFKGRQFDDSNPPSALDLDVLLGPRGNTKEIASDFSKAVLAESLSREDALDLVKNALTKVGVLDKKAALKNTGVLNNDEFDNEHVNFDEIIDEVMNQHRSDAKDTQQGQYQQIDQIQQSNHEQGQNHQVQHSQHHQSHQSYHQQGQNQQYQPCLQPPHQQSQNQQIYPHQQGQNQQYQPCLQPPHQQSQYQQIHPHQQGQNQQYQLCLQPPHQQGQNQQYQPCLQPPHQQGQNQQYQPYLQTDLHQHGQYQQYQQIHPPQQGQNQQYQQIHPPQQGQNQQSQNQQNPHNQHQQSNQYLGKDQFRSPGEKQTNTPIQESPELSIDFGSPELNLSPLFPKIKSTKHRSEKLRPDVNESPLKPKGLVYDKNGNAGWEVNSILDRRKSMIKSKGVDYLCEWLPLGMYPNGWVHQDDMGVGLAEMIDDFDKSFDSTKKVLPEVMCEKMLSY